MRKIFTFLFAALMSVGMYATTVVTITDSDFPAWGKSCTKDGVTVSAEMIDGMYGNIGGPGSFSTTLGNFTQIEVNALDVNISGEGWSGNWEKMTWTGNASSVSFTGDINGDEEEVTLKFTIEEPATVAVTGVTLNQNEAQMTVGGETLTLTATVNPNNATDQSVSWSTSDGDVATVDNGVVTAVAAGNATITVTTTDGSFTATCAVTVTAPEPQGQGIVCTAEDLDKVLCSDGSIYENVAAATAASKTAVAMIASINTTTNKVVALALADEEGTMNWETAQNTCAAKTAVAGVAWTALSVAQLNGILAAHNGGAYGNYNELNTTIANVGGTSIPTQTVYWTKDEYNDRGISFKFGMGTQTGNDNKANTYSVRACLEFDLTVSGGGSEPEPEPEPAGIGPREELNLGTDYPAGEHYQVLGEFSGPSWIGVGDISNNTITVESLNGEIIDNITLEVYMPLHWTGYSIAATSGEVSGDVASYQDLVITNINATSVTLSRVGEGENGGSVLFSKIIVNEGSATAIEKTAVEAKAIKRIVNGQLLIEKNGKIYNVMGVEVK